MHEPLSKTLKRVLDAAEQGGGITFGELLSATGGRGIFLFIIILCLPFVLPVSVPGMSTPLGLAMIGLASGFVRRKPPRLPQKLAMRPVPPKLRRALSRGGVKFLQWLEKIVRPRRTFWMSWRIAVCANTLMLIWAALLLALPLPPVPPFTNMLPSYAVILIALSMMEEDGLLIWIGHAACAGTTFYFVWWINVIAEHFAKWGRDLLHSINA